MPDEKKDALPATPAPAVRIRETKTEVGFGGNAGHTWTRVRDLEPGETPPPDSVPAGVDEQPGDWRQVS